MKSIRVYAPTDLLFICGGDCDPRHIRPVSFRGAFMNVAFSPPYNRFTVVRAEDLNPFFPKGEYRDILQLEEDIAQIAGLIVLFSESFGSAAELGAFAMMKEVSANMLVVIDSKHFYEDSFVSLGPVRSLRNRHGEGVTCVLPCADLGIHDCNDISDINLKEFQRILALAIPERFASTRPHTTFEKTNKGHVIKLIVGLLHHYGALTFEEIDTYLYDKDLTEFRSEIRNMLLCAEFAEWISVEQRGLNTYYSARSLVRVPIAYTLLPEYKANDSLRNRDRWQSDIRRYLEEKDVDRFRAISSALSR